jgi:hypothetical protein
MLVTIEACITLKQERQWGARANAMNRPKNNFLACFPSSVPAPARGIRRRKPFFSRLKIFPPTLDSGFKPHINQ